MLVTVYAKIGNLVISILAISKSDSMFPERSHLRAIGNTSYIIKDVKRPSF